MPLSPAEQAELDALRGELSAQAPAAPAKMGVSAAPQPPAAAAPGVSGGGLTPEEQAERDRLRADLGGQPGGAPEKSMGQKILGGIGNVLDYTSGLGRTAVIGGLEHSPTGQLAHLLQAHITGKPSPNIVSGDDALAAINPFDGKNAPTTAEYMDKAGVPEGGHLSDVLPVYAEKGRGAPWQMEKGGMLDLSPRGVGGFVGDVGMDPATWLSMGASGAAKAAAQEGATASEKELAKRLATAAMVANPVGTAMEAGGKSMFRSGLKKVDEVARQYGKTVMPSEVLWNNGAWGTANSMERQSSELADRLLAKRDALLKVGDDAGARVDVDRALQPVRDRMSEIMASKDPAAIKAAKIMGRNLQPYEALAATPEQKIIQGYGDQGALFRDATEISQPQKTMQAVTAADAAIPAVATGSPQQMLMPEATAASKKLPEKELIDAAFSAGKSRKDINHLVGNELVPGGSRLESGAQQTMFGHEPPMVEAQKGIPTGPNQQELFSQAATASKSGGVPKVNLEEITQGKIAPGQTELFTPGETMGPVKTTTIPGNEAPNLTQATGIKSNIYNMVGSPAYKDAAMTPVGKSLQKAHGYGWKTETERALEEALGSQQAQTLRDTHENLGALLTSKKALAKEVSKENTRNFITPVDAMLLGMGHGYGEVAKKAADASKTMLFRTGGGRALNKAGTTLPIWSKLMTQSPQSSADEQ